RWTNKNGKRSNGPVSLSMWILVAGGGVGVLYGLFGVGSAFATPVLALLGVQGLAAVVAPLPGLLPGSAAGAWSYSRRGKVDWSVARRTIVGGVPASIVGALTSRWIGGTVLLALSGIVLLAVGVRVLRLVAGVFGAGLVPGALLGGALAQRLPVHGLRKSFGTLLVVFAFWFVARQLLVAL